MSSYLAFGIFYISLILTGVWLILLTTSFISHAQWPAGSLCERNLEETGGRGGRGERGTFILPGITQIHMSSRLQKRIKGYFVNNLVLWC